MHSDFQLLLGSHFAILIHHTVDAAFFHRLAVMDMLRRKSAVLSYQHLHEQQRHSNGKQHPAYEQRLYHFECKGKQNN